MRTYRWGLTEFPSWTFINFSNGLPVVEEASVGGTGLTGGERAAVAASLRRFGPPGREEPSAPAAAVFVVGCLLRDS